MLIDFLIKNSGSRKNLEIDFFGGEKAYKKQHERDLLKAELSKKNKIKLIYVNYNEDISAQLIRKKLSEKNIVV